VLLYMCKALLKHELINTQKHSYQSRWFTDCNDDEQAPLIQTTFKISTWCKITYKTQG